MITAMHHRRRGAARGAGRRCGTPRRSGPHGPQFSSDRRQAVAEHRWWAAHSGAMTSNEAFQISAAGAEAYEAVFIPAFFASGFLHCSTSPTSVQASGCSMLPAAPGVVARGVAERTGDAGIVT